LQKHKILKLHSAEHFANVVLLSFFFGLSLAKKDNKEGDLTAMPKIDLPLKRLLQRRPADWVKYLQPQCQPDWIRPYQSDFAPKKESRLDNALIRSSWDFIPCCRS
jgi:hypothetical protein